jgi:hypothetical protein
VVGMRPAFGDVFAAVDYAFQGPHDEPAWGEWPVLDLCPVSLDVYGSNVKA